MKLRKTKFEFTLTEMIIGMTVLAVIVFILITSFNSLYKTDDISRSESELFQNANVALDILTRDLQCIYYKNEIVPFYHKGTTNYTDPDDIYNNDLLCFVSSTPVPPTDANTNICEIKYQLYSTDNLNNENAGWLMRSVTGDKSSKWNFWSNDKYYAVSGPNYAFSADTSSSENYEKLVPYVTDLNFTCYSRDSVILTNPKTFPFSIEIELKMLDRISWNRWKIIDSDHSDGESNAAMTFRRQNERTFTKAIQVGNRGQYH